MEQRDSLTELLQRVAEQEVERRKALEAAEKAFQRDGNQTTLDSIRRAQDQKRHTFLGRKVEGSVVKVSETEARLETSIAGRAFVVTAGASYRRGDPVLFGLKKGQAVHVEGTVVVRSLPSGTDGTVTISLSGCLFGTESERKAAGSGAIKDPTEAKLLAAHLLRQVAIASDGRISGLSGDELSARIALEDLIRNCPNTTEAARARDLLKRLEPATANKPAKRDKPPELAKLIAREKAFETEQRAALATGNGNIIKQVEKAHEDERKSWSEMPVGGKAVVEALNGKEVWIMIAPRSRTIVAKVKDEEDPILLKLKKGNVVRVNGVVKNELYTATVKFHLADCVFTLD